MRIPPFYGLVPGLALDSYWHNHSECFVVRSIALADRRPSTGGLPRCPYCTLLDAAVKPLHSPAPENS